MSTTSPNHNQHCNYNHNPHNQSIYNTSSFVALNQLNNKHKTDVIIDLLKNDPQNSNPNHNNFNTPEGRREICWIIRQIARQLYPADSTQVYVLDNCFGD